MSVGGIAVGVGIVCAVPVVLVTHPVLALVAEPVLGIKALVHGLFLNYHWRHTKNETGIPLNLDREHSYMNRDTKFKAVDLTRLQHEEKRIQARDRLFETLKWIRGIAKCIIPIVGLFWALTTEINTGGSIEITPCCVVDDTEHDRHWSDSEAIDWHIRNLKSQV